MASDYWSTENSGFTPPRTDFEHAGTKLYVPKINQMGEMMIGDIYKLIHQNGLMVFLQV